MLYLQYDICYTYIMIFAILTYDICFTCIWYLLYSHMIFAILTYDICYTYIWYLLCCHVGIWCRIVYQEHLLRQLNLCPENWARNTHKFTFYSLLLYTINVHYCVHHREQEYGRYFKVTSTYPPSQTSNKTNMIKVCLPQISKVKFRYMFYFYKRPLFTRVS